jgi:citrate synthase
MTGNVPDAHEFKNISEDLRRRSSLSKDAEKFIASLPRDMHPMTQLSTALLYLQTGSKFAQAYRDGLHKSKYWEVVYEDAMDLIAKLPRVAALIFRHVYKNSDIIESDPNLDWAGNYAHMLGFSDFEMKECIRGYLSIHSDHEGGNVSAHATHLVGSALADPYLSYSAGLNGLAGPLHGLANQECLRWLLDLKEELGNDISEKRIKEFAYATLNEGKVIPGYGHAVLRHTDPRYIHLREFAGRHIKNDPLVELCRNCFQVIPGVLKELGKVKNPWPNVDAHSGVLLYHYGMKEFDYYTVVFAVSRALGCMTNLVWSRAFGKR